MPFKSTVLALLLLATLVSFGGTLRAEDIFDVEHARAAERAGWPLSDNNLEYLERWGGLSSPPLRGHYLTREGYESFYPQHRKSLIKKWKRQ